MGMGMKQYDVYLVCLDPTMGHEMKKTRPCVVISPDEMNDSISTAIIAPMTTTSHDYPTRVRVRFGGKDGWIVLDQIRAVDKHRMIKKLGSLKEKEILNTKNILKEMLVD